MAVSRFFVATRFPQPFFTISHTKAPHSTLDKFEKSKISLKLRNNVALLCWIFLHKQNQIKKEAKGTFFFIYVIEFSDNYPRPCNQFSTLM